MKITIVSAFRDSESYIDRYFQQMDGLQRILYEAGHNLSLVLGYGDSNDKTSALLHEQTQHRFDAYLLDVSHGGPKYGSVVHPGRFKDLAFIGNKLWQNIPKDSDIVGLVESDLLWSAECIYSLVEGLQYVSMVSPMVLHLNRCFYDTWAFRLSGERFRAEWPYHVRLAGESTAYDMDSVGSVFFMKAPLARRLTWPEEDVVVGLCKQVRELGHKIWLIKNLEVFHP